MGGGIVLTFIDLTDRGQSEYELRLLLREFNHRVKNTPGGMVGRRKGSNFDADSRIGTLGLLVSTTRVFPN